jgi:plasmid replication initiation protein
VAEHGMVTSWGAEVLIWAASQIVEASDAGLCASRLMAARPRESLPSSDAVPTHATITV